MGSESYEEYKKLVNEIAKGKDQVTQQLEAASSSSSGNNEGALELRLTSYEEALSILNEMEPLKRLRYKRRRSEETITTRVRSDSDVPPDDGYKWRKYGQKPTLNSTRSYYRCFHKYDRGCQASKQVHRLHDDPSALEIVYISTHTCVGPANKPPPPEFSEDRVEYYSFINIGFPPQEFMLEEEKEDSSFKM